MSALPGLISQRADPLCCLETDFHRDGQLVRCAMMERNPVCDGRSIVEILEAELDVIVERLKSPDGAAADGRDPGRAEGLAMAIAVLQNPYYPDIDQVRAEAADRWEAANEEEGTGD